MGAGRVKGVRTCAQTAEYQLRQQLVRPLKVDEANSELAPRCTETDEICSPIDYESQQSTAAVFRSRHDTF